MFRTKVIKWSLPIWQPFLKWPIHEHTDHITNSSDQKISHSNLISPHRISSLWKACFQSNEQQFQKAGFASHKSVGVHSFILKSFWKMRKKKLKFTSKRLLKVENAETMAIGMIKRSEIVICYFDYRGIYSFPVIIWRIIEYIHWAVALTWDWLNSISRNGNRKNW